MSTSSLPDNFESPAQRLWTSLSLPREPLDRLHLSSTPDPAIDSSFKLGTAAQASTTIGLSGLSATHFHELRTGVVQDVSVDARHAALEFKSEAWYTIDGELPGSGSLWDEIAGLYLTKDGYVRTHTNFPHHRQGILEILNCKPTREAVAAALLTWDAVEFETVAASRHMCASALRSFEQWDQHEQGKSLRDTPPVCISKVGDARKREVKADAAYPLDGIRVLDLTRVLAGPVCGRTLAAYGADVLWITSPNLPSLPLLDAETSRGKRTTQLDLELPADIRTLESLVEDADVFLQAYRPGGLSEKGFGVKDVVNMRPGIVYASLTAYGWEGPWKDRRGFDSLVQTATGVNATEGEAFAKHSGGTTPSPRALPMQALDHAAGYLLAFGINAALCKTVTEGGSWGVRVSLAAVGQWIRSLGLLDPEIAFGQGNPFPPRTIPPDAEISTHSIEIDQIPRTDDDGVAQNSRSKMTVIRHAGILSKTPVREGEAPVVLNAHSPTWAND
ncbi:hypothetical protein JAAARDRAFT_121978 [Jaapia argillacea MUCL 33604]|uniref:CoA-transferase family III n=1 Tax=Jaapia argillacea MUCL 33604 TaxID=933084 RepID=A0A067QF77_9AGAM|nr:hypothetical protein JAAARDRAFT_121978 [Jaapia argillacea MUCL 33604]